MMQANHESTKTANSTDLRQAVSDGLLYTHSRLNANQRKTLEASSFLYALVELLHEKGLISIEELDARKQVVGQRLKEQLQREGYGAMFQDPEYDKYNFPHNAQIHCAQRIHLCQASCCRLSFALSKQDVREGIVHWNLGQPYLVEQGADGYCTHMARGTCACTIYAQRPVPCRGYDCRKDQRIWLDFDQMIPNPALAQADWLAGLAQTANEEGLP